MDLIIVAGVFTLIVLGVGTYKHYKKKARLAKPDVPAEEAPEAPKSPTVGGGGGSRSPNVNEQIR